MGSEYLVGSPPVLGSTGHFDDKVVAEAFYVASGGELSVEGLITSVVTADNIVADTAHLHEYLDLDATTTPATPAAGLARLWANNDIGHTVLQYKDNDGVVLEPLQDQIIIAHNISGSTITAGQIVRITSGTGQRPDISLASNSSSSTMPAVGIAVTSISNLAYGTVLVHGVFTGVDTSGFSEGAELFVGTSGSFTSTKPTFPNIDQSVGICINSHVNGTVYINFGGLDLHLESVTDGTNSYDDHPRKLSFNSNHFYLSGDLTGEPVVNLRHESAAKHLTLQYPSRRDTVTWFKNLESECRVEEMHSFLRTKDSGFYPFCAFTIRYGSAVPSRSSGTELTPSGWIVGFYPGHIYLTENPLIRTSFSNNTIPINNWVWLETTNLGEGDGVEEELHVSVKLRRQ